MTVSYIDWKGWKAVKATFGMCELITGVSAGPRILSLRYKGSSNLLYEDETNFGEGDWRLYGGHRFTIAPETEKSYEPDNGACHVRFNGTNLIVAAPIRSDKLRLSMEISPLAVGAGFRLEHVLQNEGDEDWTGALWAITCVPRASEISADCVDASLRSWPGTDPENWLPKNGRLSIRKGDFRGKVGWHQMQGKLAAWQPYGSLVIRNTEDSLPQECVDGGSNLEVFACKEWAELETLGKERTVEPNASARHVQEWRVAEGPLSDVLM